MGPALVVALAMASQKVNYPAHNQTVCHLFEQAMLFPVLPWRFVASALILCYSLKCSLCSVLLCSQPGSSVICCTDGLANIGLVRASQQSGNLIPNMLSLVDYSSLTLAFHCLLCIASRCRARLMP